MPWKNGLGMTREIHRADGADGAMLWRVSMAGIASDGPFSAFPGYDRHLMVLSGEGLLLHGLGEGSVRLEPSSAPVAFSGDAPVSARLIGGAVTDFNLFARRGLLRSSLAVEDVVGRFSRLAGAHGLVHILQGEGISAAGQLRPGDSLLTGPAETIDFTATRSGVLRLAVATVWTLAQ